MIDSSKWSVLEAGLRCVQGKCMVNSISLKGGEEDFIRQARLVRRYGAATMVMAFDERGQADSFERRTEICARAYRILTEQAGFPPRGNRLRPEHPDGGHRVWRSTTITRSISCDATRWIKENLPHARVSGGVSNISFSFRGNNAVREAMHSAFLYHAIRAGLDMGIVNAGQLAVYEEIPKELLELVEDVLLNRRPDATERLVEFAETVKSQGRRVKDEAWRDGAGRGAAFTCAGEGNRRLHRSRHRGGAPQAAASAGCDRRAADGRDEHRGRSVRRGEDVFAAGGEERAGDEKGGGLFDALHGGGKDRRRRNRRARIIMATVKGDVHDIGKNIVGVVLQCNNYEVIDLGVMVPAEKILDAARERQADVIGLSGLITPSLDEMVHVAREMERLEFHLPLLIGGATTSRAHTAVKIAPHYRNPVVHVLDASRAVGVVSSLLSDELRAGLRGEDRGGLRAAAARSTRPRNKDNKLIPIAEARANRTPIEWEGYAPPQPEFTGARRSSRRSRRWWITSTGRLFFILGS